MQDCSYIIDHYQAEEVYKVNSETNRKVLDDYKVTAFPTKAFQHEQYRTNVHNKNILNHKVDAFGKPIIKPMRDQYPTKYDFERYMEDKEKYDNAQSVQISKKQ